jgi:predicted aspartyl protease
MLIKGNITNFIPVLNGKFDQHKGLFITRDGDISLTVDTGFSGGVALPLDVLEKLNIKLAFYDTFKIATGEVIELPVYVGKATIAEVELETWFIPGDFLLGMEFLSAIASLLSFDFNSEEVSLFAWEQGDMIVN